MFGKRDEDLMSKKDLDFLMIYPSSDFEKERKRREGVKVEGDIVRQVSPNIGIAYMLATAKKAGLKVDFVDMAAYEVTPEEVTNYVRQTRPSVVGFYAFTTQVKSAALVADRIKDLDNNILIGLGGPHATATPDGTLKEFQSFDFTVPGEGEDVIVDLFSNLKNYESVLGLRSRSGFSPVIKTINLDELPFPAWEEFNHSRYGGADPHLTSLELPMSSSRGCPFKCTFCHQVFGHDRRHRSIDSLMEEMERNITDFGAEATYFTDETFIINKKWSAELFQTMIDRGISEKMRFSAAVRVDINSPELFKLMKEAGCYYIFFGFENADDGMLKTMDKRTRSHQMKQAVRWAQDAGITVTGSFILGLPGETEETAYKSMHLGKELGLYSVTFPIAVPFPGTRLRKQAEAGEYGLKILSNNWDDYGKQYPGVMESETLSIHRLRELQKEAYELNPKHKLEDYLHRDFMPPEMLARVEAAHQRQDQVRDQIEAVI